MGSLVLWLSGYRYIQIHSLLSMAFPETVSLEKAPIIESALYPKVIITEYVFNQLSPRAYGFFIYPAALGGAMIFLIALTLAYSKMAGKKRITSLPILLLEFLALVLSLSRIAFLGLFLAWIVVSLYANLKKRWLSFSITLQVFLIVLISLLVPPGQVINKMSELKKGSNITRMELYELTLRLILQRPLLGHGFKPREEEYPEPIGSHSMYLGTILKTGILGFLVFCVFWIRLIIKWIRQKSMVKNDKILGPLWYYLGISLIGGLIWMITEDLDAPPVVSFLYFIILGLIISLDRLSNSESKKSGNNATF
jgi:O-antigen ligase